MGEKLASTVIGKVFKEDHQVESSQVLELSDHLRELYDIACQKENLTTGTGQEFRELLLKHGTLFATSDTDLGRKGLVI